ncbi:MAG TPA: OmpH family outer membrane protein, partial [Gemmatimonadaceae bacterium]|nr:OmpH family outer membrane protein [Gemmatimonadaceae bacterium]
MSSFFRTACATLAVLTLTVGGTTARAQSAPSQFKIAFVNVGVLLDNAPGKTQAESTYARETRAYSDQLKKMSDSLNTMFA